MVGWKASNPPENCFNHRAWWVWNGSTIFLAKWDADKKQWIEAQSHFFHFEPEKITHYCSVSHEDLISEIVTQWCNCDFPKGVESAGNFISCVSCHLPINCEICENDTLATVKHLDYIVCKDHEEAAINAVADRRW